MPDRIRVNEKLNIIEIRSYGMVTSDDIAASIAKMVEISQERKIYKALVDTIEQEYMPSAFAIYKLFSQFPRQFRVALFMKKGQATANDIRFVETIVSNRGFQIRVFQNRQHAMRWLNAVKEHQLRT